MYLSFAAVEDEGESLWMDFISTFRPHTNDAWPKCLIYIWSHVLRSRGVHTGIGRYISRSEALERLLFRISRMKAKLSISRERRARFEDKSSFSALIPEAFAHRFNDVDQNPHAVSVPVGYKVENMILMDTQIRMKTE